MDRSTTMLFCTFFFLMLFYVSNGITLLLDPGVSESLNEVSRGDETYSILIEGKMAPRRRSKDALETLITIEDPTEKKKVSLILDRVLHKVLLETSESDDGVRIQEFPTSSLTNKSSHKSVVFEIKPHKEGLGHPAALYLDCQHVATIAIAPLDKQKKGKLRMHRERRFNLKVISEAASVVLEGLGCGHVEERKKGDFDAEGLQKGDEDFQKRNPVVTEEENEIFTYRRGDIPIFSQDLEDRESQLIKTLGELIGTLKQLQLEVQANRQETRNLKETLENCEMCRYSRPTCLTHPCYPGVQCSEGAEGIRCGQCPAGYIGDGRSCKAGIGCRDRPCFPGVRCYDTSDGFQCGPCPQSYEGDGQRCKRRSYCENSPCHPGTQCHDLEESPFYRCGACPTGFTGNGTVCLDIDEPGFHKHHPDDGHYHGGHAASHSSSSVAGRRGNYLASTARRQQTAARWDQIKNHKRKLSSYYGFN